MPEPIPCMPEVRRCLCSSRFDHYLLKVRHAVTVNGNVTDTFDVLLLQPVLHSMNFA